MMSKFRITDESVHAAFDTLNEMVNEAATASVMKVRYDEERRRAKARAFLNASGTMAEKEAKSILAAEYIEACEKYYEAYKRDEYYRNMRNKADSIIRGWQSCQANIRSLQQVS